MSCMSERHFVKYTFLKLDPAWRRLQDSTARAGQARVHRRLRGLRRRAPAAGLLARRHARRRRAAADLRGGEPRPHPRAARGAGPERADEVGADPVLVPGYAQELGVLRRRAHDPRGFRGKYVFVYPFVKSREWYALPAEERWRIMQGHIQVGPRIPGRGQPHDVLVRAGRPGVRGRVRHRRRRHVPRPRAAPAHDRGVALTRCATRRASPAWRCRFQRALNALDGEPVAFEVGLAS